MRKKVKVAMVGGGIGSLIGPIHRLAIQMDGEMELVAGCFSRNYEVSLKTAEQWYIPKDRVYPDYVALIEEESKKPEKERPDVIAVMTPNISHYEIVEKAILHGFHVMCDKPLTYTLEQAFKIKELLEQHPEIKFGVTYTYGGYAMVKEARYLVNNQKILGNIHKIVVEYTMGTFIQPVEKMGIKQAWRLDPAVSGKSCTMADIGVHAFFLTEYISGLKTSQLNAFLNVIGGEERRLDNDGSIWLKMNNGATGILIASQTYTGEENNLSIRIYGDKASLTWSHNDPEFLTLKYPDKPMVRLRKGGNGVSHVADAHARFIVAHHEGFLEAFSNIYRNFAYDIQERDLDKSVYDYPSIEEGVRGMIFVERAVESHSLGQKWVDFE